MKCSNTLIFKWTPDQKIEKASVCGESTEGFLPDFWFAIFGGFFLIMVLMNIHIFLYFSESIRPNRRGRIVRRNLHPELASAWMFLFYFLFEDLKENSFIQLIVPLIGYAAIIYLVLKTGSFTSEN